MSIQEYFNHIKALSDEYASTEAVLDVQITLERRPGEQGYLNGFICFKDGSSLYFKEFLDSLDGELDKLMYSYHYQDESEHLIFRYDNALHKPDLPFSDHKYLPETIKEASIPTLEAALLEIFTQQHWM